MKKPKKLINNGELRHILQKFRIRKGVEDFTIREDGYIDVIGDIRITNTKSRKIPLKFGTVAGHFYCNSNQLTSLKNAPKYVGGDFNCSGNKLRTLKYSPIQVGGDFYCQENILKNLKGSPQQIQGNFDASQNQIEILTGSPALVGGNCFLHHNELTSLVGGPIHIGGSYFVAANLLLTLLGSPSFIGDIFMFDDDVKMDLGNKNCEVKSVMIQVQDAIPKSERSIPQIIFDNERYLPTVFKYFKWLELFTDHIEGQGERVFNESNFNDIIMDIKEGLR